MGPEQSFERIVYREGRVNSVHLEAELRPRAEVSYRCRARAKCQLRFNHVSSVPSVCQRIVPFTFICLTSDWNENHFSLQFKLFEPRAPHPFEGTSRSSIILRLWDSVYSKDRHYNTCVYIANPMTSLFTHWNLYAPRFWYSNLISCKYSASIFMLNS